MSGLRKTLSICLAGLALTACGPLNENSAAKGFLGVATGTVARLSGQAQAAAPAQPPLTRAQADANPGAFLLVTAYGGASVVSMVPVSINGIRQTWISADNVTITLENGIIVATRGFPGDLMAADIGQVRQALAAGSGQARRVHETLDGTDQISTELLQCSIASTGTETINILQRAVPTRRVEESCTGQSTAFTNTYWIGSDGNIARSRQAISPEAGFVQIDRP